MKRIFILILFLPICSIAQTLEQRPIETFYQPNQPNHVYYKDVNNLLDKYVGTWVYDDGTHYFRIEFFKQTFFRETPMSNTKITIYTDKIYGHYQYKLNGVEVYNVTDSQSAIATAGAFTSQGFFIFFKEPSNNACGRNIIGEVTMSYSITNNIEKINWTRTDTYRGPLCYPFDTTPFQTPANMVLTKVQ